MSWQALQRVDALRSIGRLADAEREAREALADDPQNARLLVALAGLSRRQNRPAEALAAADAAVHAAPEMMAAHAQRALALSCLNRHPDAVAAARHCVALEPFDADALLVASAVEVDAGHTGPAYAAATRAAGLAPYSPEAHVMVGFTATRSGDRTTARRAYEEALRLDPANERARHDIALLDLYSGKTSRAIDGFLAVGELAPSTELPLMPGIRATVWRVTVYVRWLLIASYLAISVFAETDSERTTSRIAAAVSLLVSAGIAVRYVRGLPDRALPIVRQAVRSDRMLTATVACLIGGLAANLTVLVLGETSWSAITLLLMVVAAVLTFLSGRPYKHWRERRRR